jgi:predicted dehydrogenase
MGRTLRVGIIGVSADGGWAKESHVPAVQVLPGLDLAAVASNGQAKSDAAARAFGVKAAYASGADLIRDPDIDLVSVCVGGPDHRELVLAALAAGKHVYCEWPLGRNTAEAVEMGAAVDSAGVHAAVGLQTRMNPAAIRARELIVSGAIGRPLSAHAYSSTVGFGPIVPTMYLYLEKAENGVNLITIQGAHTIDLAIGVLGGLADMSALTTTQYSEIKVGDDRKRQVRETFDHLLVQSRLSDGGALSLEVAGGRPPGDTPFRLEVIGEKGTLALDGGAARGFQSGRLRLSLNGQPQRVDDGELASMPDSAASVAGIYAALRKDISSGTGTAPDFRHAVRLSQLIDDVMASSQTGTRKEAADWPV